MTIPNHPHRRNDNPLSLQSMRRPDRSIPNQMTVSDIIHITISTGGEVIGRLYRFDMLYHLGACL